MKVYLAHSIATTAEKTDSIRVASEIRKLGFDVYAAAENNSINDKSNDPTPIDIYNADVSELLSSDILVVNLTGGLQDGTISEIGVVAGYNENMRRIDVSMGDKPRIIIAYTSNERLLQPQHFKNVPSAGANHLVLGMIEKWGSFVGTEKEMLKALNRLIRE